MFALSLLLLMLIATLSCVSKSTKTWTVSIIKYGSSARDETNSKCEHFTFSISLPRNNTDNWLILLTSSKQKQQAGEEERRHKFHCKNPFDVRTEHVVSEFTAIHTTTKHATHSNLTFDFEACHSRNFSLLMLSFHSSRMCVMLNFWTALVCQMINDEVPSHLAVAESFSRVFHIPRAFSLSSFSMRNVMSHRLHGGESFE